MATLDDYTEQLKNCSNGYQSRAIIINALKTINEKGGNATTLGDHPLSYFALKSDLSKYLY